MQREVQPRGIQGLFQKFKRAEAQRNRNHQLQRQPQPGQPNAIQPEQQRGNIVSLSEKAQQQLQALRATLERAANEERIYREQEPKGNPLSVEDWIAYRRMRRSKEPYVQAPLTPEQQTPQKVATSEQRKKIATNMYKTLAGEVESRQMQDAAQILQKEVWRDDPANPQATIRRYGEMNITMNTRTGRIKDLSQVGYALFNQAQGRDLYFGVRYVNSRVGMLQETTGSVSDANLELGAKVYYIEKINGDTRTVTHIPCAYAEALPKFLDRLHDEAVDLVPNQATQQLAA